MLSLPAGHRLLGRVVCRAGGCDATAHGAKTGGLCWRCFARLTRAGLSAGEITSSPELPPLPDRPPGGAVPVAADVAGREAGAAARPVPRIRAGSAGSPG